MPYESSGDKRERFVRDWMDGGRIKDVCTAYNYYSYDPSILSDLIMAFIDRGPLWPGRRQGTRFQCGWPTPARSGHLSRHPSSHYLSVCGPTMSKHGMIYALAVNSLAALTTLSRWTGLGKEEIFGQGRWWRIYPSVITTCTYTCPCRLCLSVLG